MITVGVIRNGATYLTRHLCKNDYWTEGEKRIEGEWIGKGAKALGLEGSVQAKAFDALRRNCHPDTGEQLTARENKDRVAFFDVQLLGLSLFLCLFLGLVLCGLSLAYVFGLKNNRPEHYDTDFFEMALVEAGVMPVSFGPRAKRPPNPFRAEEIVELRHHAEEGAPRKSKAAQRTASPRPHTTVTATTRRPARTPHVS